MSATVAFSWKHFVIALAGAACITWLAASLSPAPRFSLTPADEAPARTDSSFREHAPGGTPNPAMQVGAPTPRLVSEVPPAPSKADAHAPRGRSFKCVVGDRVEYADRPCAEGADTSLVNVNPAMMGAVPARR